MVQFGFTQTKQTGTKQRDLLKTASALERSGRFDLAADTFIKLSLINPRNIGPYLGAKRCLLKVQKYSKLENFILSLQKKRRDIRYEVDLAELLYISGDSKSAIKRWESIVKENSKSHQAYSLIGNSYQQFKLYDKAIDLYINARETFKDEKLYIFELAGIYQILAKHDLMVAEYVRYLLYNKSQISFVDSRIAAASENTDAQKSIEKQLKRSLKNDKNDTASLYQLLGSFYLRSKEYKEAFVYFKLLEAEGLKKSENKRNQNIQGAHLFKYTQVLIKDSQFDLAGQALEIILQLYPKSVYGRKADFGLAVLYEKQQLYQQAIVSYSAFHKKHPKTTEGLQALLRIGEIQYNILFDLKSASKTFEDIIAKYKNAKLLIQAQEKLAKCYIALGKLDDAIESLTRVKALSGGPSTEMDKNASFEIAQIEIYKGHYNKSLKILEDMLQTESAKGVADFAENDALELMLLIKSNLSDSLSLATYGNAKLLNRQRQYLESNKELQNIIATSPETPLIEDAKFLEHENFIWLSDHKSAINSLSTIYKNEYSLNRDLALLLIAKIFEENLVDFESAEQYLEKLLIEFPHSIYIEETRQRIRQVLASKEVL
jgi:tetratricopeptide (TPR) repeat protein